MATRLGANALHIGHLTGSLEPGKRADLILVDISPLHNSPRFRRDPDNAYAQIVYASKSTDVTDVMVNGKWLLRGRQLLTLNEQELLANAADVAKRIDSFLIEREQSVLSKLIALGGLMEQESFEVQIKVKVDDLTPVHAGMKKGEIETMRFRHYRQYDNYFLFGGDEGRVRFREDDLIDAKGEVGTVRTRLTLIGPAREGKFDHDVLLSRSRFLAPADHTLRFYREYFKPQSEIAVQKDRHRWLIKYKDTEFFVNLDTMEQPSLGSYVEIKSRTWSRKDADNKAKLVGELLAVIGAADGKTVTQDYIEIVQESE
jgi:5-methylthioadenosine/S-adenosylhomocysteine deaminase